jgi:hypothetical protein
MTTHTINSRNAAASRISVAAMDIRLAAALAAVSQKMTAPPSRRIDRGFYQESEIGTRTAAESSPRRQDLKIFVTNSILCHFRLARLVDKSFIFCRSA